ncbi:MAG: ORF6N domain-containing protein [Bacteroidia bacterium]
MRKSRAIKLNDDVVVSKLYLIRGIKVMLDSDLAELYKVTTGNLNKAVARNIKRFPPDFMFRLSREEMTELENSSSDKNWGGKRQCPFVFTEQGVAMLSGVLSSDRAIEVNIQIMRVFSKVRQLLIDNTLLGFELEEIKQKIHAHDKTIISIIEHIHSMINKPEVTKKRKRIGYKIPSKSKQT